MRAVKLNFRNKIDTLKEQIENSKRKSASEIKTINDKSSRLINTTKEIRETAKKMKCKTTT